MEIFLFQKSVRSISRFFCGLARRAERDEEAESHAALGLGFESPADIAVRPHLVREDVPERAHEQAVERRGLAREGVG